MTRRLPRKLRHSGRVTAIASRCAARLPGITALLAFFALALAFAPLASAQSFETRAQAAYVLDYTTGTVLLEHNADIPLPPASMSKLMTLYMLFEALEDGRIDMDTTFRVSTRAREKGGSKMFLDETQRPTALELIRGIIVHSGNDATIVVAEGLGGSEEDFAVLMTARARSLGMTGTTLRNSSGWPDPEHRMSMRDLGILTQRLIEDFPDLYPYFAETTFTWANITQNNRNPLLGRVPGADGLKTGHTSEAGYGLVGSAVEGNRRVIFVINGLASERERLEESERILNWAFRQFVERDIVSAGARVAEAEVWLGTAQSVGLVAPEGLRLLVPAIAQGEIAAEVVYDGPVPAPVAAGQPIAELVVRVPGMQDTRVPLVAESPVPEGGFTVRVRTAAETLLRRALGS